MRLLSGFQIFRQSSERSRRTSWLPSGGGREGIQDRHLPPQEKASGGFVSRNENLRDIAPTISVRDIVIAVSEYSGVPTQAILGTSRVRELSRQRFLVCLLAHELSYQSLMNIGRALNRDHSTIYYGVKRYRELMLNDAKLEKAYNDLYTLLKGPA